MYPTADVLYVPKLVLVLVPSLLLSSCSSSSTWRHASSYESHSVSLGRRLSSVSLKLYSTSMGNGSESPQRACFRLNQ